MCWACGAAFGTTAADRELIMIMALKCADIGHPAKPLTLHLRWTEMITAEFESQARAATAGADAPPRSRAAPLTLRCAGATVQMEKEQQMGLPVSMLVRRDPRSMAQSQIGFIKFLVEPCFRPFSEHCCSMLWMEHVHANLAHWDSQCVLHRERRRRRCAHPCRGASAGCMLPSCPRQRARRRRSLPPDASVASAWVASAAGQSRA